MWEKSGQKHDLNIVMDFADEFESRGILHFPEEPFRCAWWGPPSNTKVPQKLTAARKMSEGGSQAYIWGPGDTLVTGLPPPPLPMHKAYYVRV